MDQKLFSIQSSPDNLQEANGWDSWSAKIQSALGKHWISGKSQQSGIPKNSTFSFSKNPVPNVKPVDNLGRRLYLCCTGFDVGVSHFDVLGKSNAFGTHVGSLTFWNPKIILWSLRMNSFIWVIQGKYLFSSVDEWTVFTSHAVAESYGGVSALKTFSNYDHI